MNVSYEMLMNAAKCQGYSFYRFGVIKEEPTGEGYIFWNEAKMCLETKIGYSMNKYLFKVSKKGTRKTFLCIVLVSLLLTLNKYCSMGNFLSYIYRIIYIT